MDDPTRLWRLLQNFTWQHSADIPAPCPYHYAQHHVPDINGSEADIIRSMSASPPPRAPGQKSTKMDRGSCRRSANHLFHRSIPTISSTCHPQSCLSPDPPGAPWRAHQRRSSQSLVANLLGEHILAREDGWSGVMRLLCGVMHGYINDLLIRLLRRLHLHLHLHHHLYPHPHPPHPAPQPSYQPNSHPSNHLYSTSSAHPIPRSTQ
jgi:hypothetical protein